MMTGRFARDDQVLGDFLVRHPTGQQPQDFHLTAGQAGRPAWPAGGPVPGGGQDGGRSVAVYPARPRLGPQLRCRLRRSAGGAVWARLGPRTIEIGSGQHPALGLTAVPDSPRG